MPREGHKFSSWSIRSLSTHFNPHTPRGARQRDVDFGVIPKTFQSTCPARGTTISSTVFEPLPLDFNPRAPRGARPAQHLPHPFVVSISIHVPREGHDHPVSPSAQPISAFQSTCPARGTTAGTRVCLPSFPDFNPRAPRGARPSFDTSLITLLAISIHVPREGHDAGCHGSCGAYKISIHVPREGHD